jgi:small-conductance mechanosensitive channel
VGDIIDVGDLFGEVRHIGFRASTVRTRRGADIIIPNAEFITARVSNWTFGDRLRRIDIPVGVAYASDPKKVIGVLEKVARANPRVLSTPAPFCFFMNYGDSSINFELRVWTDQSSDYIQLRSELNAAVYDAVKAAGMSFPFPQREIRLLSDPDPRVSLSSQTDEPLASENRSDDSGNRSA